MILVGLLVFLVICMSVQSCQTGYRQVSYEDLKGNQAYTCCYQGSTGYNPVNDVCTGAPEGHSDNMIHKDLLDNIKVLSAHAYMVIIVLMMALAVLGAAWMAG